MDEFASRIFEEMDFKNEAQNIKRFDALYGPNGTNRKTLPPPGFVRVPGLIPQFPPSRRVLVMEWLQGERISSLVGRGSASYDEYEGECDVETWESEQCEKQAASMALIDLGIRCTLSQLIETGVMHADPHGGNLLRLNTTGELAYLDFGLISDIPPSVRDGIVAAVTLLLFDRDYEAVAGLFGELQLVPKDVIENPYQFESLVESLRNASDAALSFKEEDANLNEGLTKEEKRVRKAELNIPDVRFDQLLAALIALVPRYRFVLPPYFLNNARALGTLEGMARAADPKFNILAVVYPFAVKRLLRNPTRSPVIWKTLRRLVCDEGARLLSLRRLIAMVEDAAALTGVSRFRVISGVLKTKQGWALAAESVLSAVWWSVRKTFALVFFLTGITMLRGMWKRWIKGVRDGKPARS